MSTWQRNLEMALERKEVIILHGNVRDKYMAPGKGLVYGNLTALIHDMARISHPPFSKLVFYDSVGQERHTTQLESSSESLSSDAELSETAPNPTSERNQPAPRVLAKWQRELSSSKERTLATIFYLDKLISYKASYQPDEQEILLRLEKLIENIAPSNRLIMVALQETMIPVELTTNSPKVTVLPIPAPDNEDRKAYLAHRLGRSYDYLDLVAGLTEGLFLRDIDSLVQGLEENSAMGTREIRGLINKYRVGEQQDYWGSLDIERLDSAFNWFINEEGVKGQDEAVQKVVEVMTLARAGLSGMASGTMSKPKGVLFFAGPTGVGKTFLAKKLAKFLFGSEEAFIRFDMSELKEEHSDSKLIGSPPGYVGYERGGMLTSAVREKPFSVILFDEIEKAHPKIMDIFLQILDEGRLTDSRGQTVFFTETVIIFTSNIGTRTQDSRARYIPEKDDLDAILKNDSLSDVERSERAHAHFTKAARDFFIVEISRPELLNRIGDNIVPFNFIDSSEMQKEIITSHFGRIKGDFEDRFKALEHRIEFTDSVVSYLAEKHRDIISNFGGRAITNAIEDEIMKPLSKALLAAEYNASQGVTFRVAVENGKIRVGSASERSTPVSAGQR